MLAGAARRRWTGFWAALAAFALALPLRAEDSSPRRPPPPSEAAASRLSGEDAALVRDLALLERMEMLRDLDLFEGPPEPSAARDAGSPGRER